MAAAESTQFWSFDVSSLMVLIGESEEQKYRLARRSLLESLAAAPVSGLQGYLRSYEFLLDLGCFEYFSPYGCKKAPLRNMQFENAVRKGRLLEDHRYTCFQIPAQPRGSRKSGRATSDEYLLYCWVLSTWTIFAGIMVFCAVSPWTTWVGFATCSVLTLWSIILRLMEWALVIPSSMNMSEIADPNSTDAIFILGRGASGLVLEGSRQDIKRWTSCGLVYRKLLYSRIPARYCQWFTRVGTMAVVLFIFSTVPNGSTMDQLAFIALNITGQFNTLIGLRLNARCCLSRLIVVESQADVPYRTNVYGNIIRKFSHLEDFTWLDKAGLIPDTPLWLEWRTEFVKDPKQDPKQLYNRLSGAQHKKGNIRIETDQSQM
ncbi:hypothetical protein DPV78_002695 [Talaromyces pinophilus]|nr:hypothetical protein DPV78_002695 [Talaromyces pinophilus]